MHKNRVHIISEELKNGTIESFHPGNLIQKVLGQSGTSPGAVVRGLRTPISSGASVTHCATRNGNTYATTFFKTEGPNFTGPPEPHLGAPVRSKKSRRPATGVLALFGGKNCTFRGQGGGGSNHLPPRKQAQFSGFFWVVRKIKNPGLNPEQGVREGLGCQPPNPGGGGGCRPPPPPTSGTAQGKLRHKNRRHQKYGKAISTPANDAGPNGGLLRDPGAKRWVTKAGVEKERNVAHMPNDVPQRLRPEVGSMLRFYA